MNKNSVIYNLKPKHRTKLRIFIGIRYYRSLRYLNWIIHGKKYAKMTQFKKLDYEIFAHKTPIYRKLKDVDMWLQENKAINLSIAANKINGVRIQPGKTFSYWKLIGKPTKEKGYKDGMVLHYGEITYGTGGGLCQLSNLIYWMTLHSPLSVVERYRHSYDVFPDSNRNQPFGSGATCVYNYRDLVIKNETDDVFQINVWIDGDYLHGEICSDQKNIFNMKYMKRLTKYNMNFGARIADIIRFEGKCITWRMR